MKRKNLLIGAIVAALMAGPAVADAKHRHGGKHQRDFAKVTQVTPIYESVRVTTPRQECWTEEVTHRRGGHGQDAAPTILGGIIGGAIGNEIGRKHKDGHIATVAGALLGAAIGSDASRHSSRRHDGGYYTTTEDRCHTSYETTTEQQTVGYWVEYKYHGRTYTTRMDEQPGRRIPIEVTVRPAY
jgi:uncharacterized protein YcfJ